MSVLDCRIEGNRLVLAGRIDENADLSRQALALLSNVRDIDLSGLTRINSIGVREWMDFAASFAGGLNWGGTKAPPVTTPTPRAPYPPWTPPHRFPGP